MGSRPDPKCRPGLVLLSAMVLLTAMVTSIVGRAIRRQQRLVHGGLAAIATVTGIDGATVRHTFVAGSENVESKFLYQASSIPRPAVGDKFVVLYEERSPSVCVPWPLVSRNYERPGAMPDVTAEVAVPTVPPALPQKDGNPAVRFSWQLPLVVVVFSIVLTPVVSRYATAQRAGGVISILRSGNRETSGLVVSREVVHGQHYERLLVRYRYTVAARTYDASYAESSIHRQEHFENGARIIVTYALREPSVSVPFPAGELERAATQARAEVLFALIIGGGIALIFGWTAWRTVVEWRFARRGKLSAGVVLEMKGTLFRRLRYRYLTSHGDAVQTASIQARTLHAAVGDQIEILYLDHPLRSMPLRDLIFVKRT